MPTFRYLTIGSSPAGDVNGHTAAPTIDASDRGAAIRELVRRGLTPTSIEPVEVGSSEPHSIDRALPERSERRPPARASVDGISSPAPAPARSVLSRSEAAALVRELATAVQAGLPLIQGLRTIARQGRNQRQKDMLARVIDDVEHGRSLADAVAAQGRTFSELTVNLVRAGEASGRLGEVLMQAADLLDRDVKLRRSVLAATLYPMILACLITIAVIIVVTVIVPQILKPLAGQVITLPWPTRVVQGVANTVTGYWWLIVPLVLLAVVGLSRFYRRPVTRLWFDRTILRTPLIGRLMRDVAVGRFTRTLGTLTAAGIPAVAALRITKGTLGNRAMEQVIDEVCEQVTGGKTIADPMEASGYFPPMLVQIINLGERSGRLDQMLNQAAAAFEDKTETSVKLFTTALPPLLVVVLACVVGFVVLSILLPLLEMQEALS